MANCKKERRIREKELFTILCNSTASWMVWRNGGLEQAAVLNDLSNYMSLLALHFYAMPASSRLLCPFCDISLEFCLFRRVYCGRVVCWPRLDVK